MSQLKEERLKKVVGILISVLGSEYSDSRDLAKVQLIQLCPDAIPYLEAYMADQRHISEDIEAMKKVASKHYEAPHAPDRYDKGPKHEESLRAELQYIEDKKKYDSLKLSQRKEVETMLNNIRSKYRISLKIEDDGWGGDYLPKIMQIQWPPENERQRLGMTLGVDSVLQIVKD